MSPCMRLGVRCLGHVGGVSVCELGEGQEVEKCSCSRMVRG